MITRFQLKNFLEKYKALDDVGEKFLDRIPREIRSAFFDNPYVDSLSRQVDLILRTWLNTKPLLEEVDWFMYEWSTKDDLNKITTGDGRIYVIDSVDNFLDYLVDQGLITEDIM